MVVVYVDGILDNSATNFNIPVTNSFTSIVNTMGSDRYLGYGADT